ncbi:hypothetical protein T4D_2109 [Trichinella pseudospiralis]|uniref:Uncharacterized protein n=1 Tax=Trichinella pseudospiralis TaxID=6337 RepID=A0A0V1FDT9_TRIPS|nr:hypothetical protein T4D_2109 [Trichinella pseudospiralis]
MKILAKKQAVNQKARQNFRRRTRLTLSIPNHYESVLGRKRTSFRCNLNSATQREIGCCGDVHTNGKDDVTQKATEDSMNVPHFCCHCNLFRQIESSPSESCGSRYQLRRCCSSQHAERPKLFLAEVVYAILQLVFRLSVVES